MMKIKIVKNGPYLVMGNVPLEELIIQKGKNGYYYKKGKTFKHEETYALCRCGKTKTPPFCDGSHIKEKFDGTLTASKEPISKYAEKYIGKNLILEDTESLCAFARFCHTNDNDAWNLATSANDNEEEGLAIKVVTDCPAGRLVIKDKKTGMAIEPSYEPSIAILQDPDEKCSGPIWVKGGIPIEDDNGDIYEIRNRVTLCRCGYSKNKPFCDAEHIRNNYND